MTIKGWLSTIVALGSLLIGAATASDSSTKVEHLRDLKDGDTKVYGSGDHKVTATRAGDTITLTLPAGKDGRESTMTIDLGDGDGTVITMDGEKIGSGNGEGKVVVLKKKVRIDGKNEDAEVIASGSFEGGGGSFAFSATGDADIEPIWVGKAGKNLIKIGALDERLLRCPKGDATLHVVKDDKATYYCPKHNVAMEETKGRAFSYRTMVVTDDDEEESKPSSEEGAKDKAPTSSKYQSQSMGGGEAKYTGKRLSLDF